MHSERIIAETVRPILVHFWLWSLFQNVKLMQFFNRFCVLRVVSSYFQLRCASSFVWNFNANHWVWGHLSIDFLVTLCLFNELYLLIRSLVSHSLLMQRSSATSKLFALLFILPTRELIFKSIRELQCKINHLRADFESSLTLLDSFFVHAPLWENGTRL